MWYLIVAALLRRTKNLLLMLLYNRLGQGLTTDRNLGALGRPKEHRYNCLSILTTLESLSFKLQKYVLGFIKAQLIKSG